MKHPILPTIKKALTGLCILLGLSATLQAQSTITIGSGSSSQQYLPDYAYYSYSYTQQIYTAAELVSAGAGSGPKLITKIQFKLSGSPGTFDNWKNWTVYLGNTNKDEFPSYLVSASDWIPTSSMTQVFSGNINSNSTPSFGAWITIDLQNNFLWDGTSNLVIAVDENSSNYTTVGFNSYTSPNSKYRGMYYGSDYTNPDPNSPPAPTGSTYNLAQVKFDIASPTPCSGTPSGGSISPSSGNVCSNVPFTIQVAGATGGSAGLNRRWQSGTNGTSWSDISPAVTAPELTTSFAGTAGTKRYYRYAVTCTNSGQTGYSNAYIANILCYCTPTMNSSSSYYINDFYTSGGVNNISNMNSGYSSNPAPGVGDYTSQKVTIEKGETISFTANINSYTYNTAGFKVWVDWNGDGDFAETTGASGEKVFQTSGYVGSATGTISVPSAVNAGNYRMRVGMNYSSSSGPTTACATYISGEYEDYTLEVVIPTCFKPSNVTHSAVNATTTKVSWAAASPLPAQGYEYIYNTTGTPPGYRCLRHASLLRHLGEFKHQSRNDLLFLAPLQMLRLRQKRMASRVHIYTAANTGDPPI